MTTGSVAVRSIPPSAMPRRPQNEPVFPRSRQSPDNSNIICKRRTILSISAVQSTDTAALPGCFLISHVNSRWERSGDDNIRHVGAFSAIASLVKHQFLKLPSRLEFFCHDRPPAQQSYHDSRIMMAHGFRREMLAGLVLAELATVVTRMMRTGGATTMKIDHYLITDDGREALGEI